jgi:4-hydroxy-tetrahydrodipicolinate synthase
VHTPSSLLTSDRIEGVYTPIVTPFRDDESIDDAAFVAVLERQLDAGVAGIVVGGTTGEYYAMSLEERRSQLEAASSIVGDRAQLIAGCNTGATRDVVALARHARELGYQAIMLSPPPTSLPSQTQLAEHIELSAIDGGLPVVLYNYPARSGVEFGFECLDRLADRSDVIAIKESSGDFSRFMAIQRRYAGRIEVMCGTDDQAFDYMMWGVRSWLAGPANVLPVEHVGFVETMLRGDHELGRAMYSALLPFIQELEAGNYNSKVKAGMVQLGVAAGTVRRPMTQLLDDDRDEFGALVEESRRAFEAATASRVEPVQG